ncbi:uncharacterized protein [Pyxicephalus adspersus]|uniref:WAP domain-containing protein n=1 Tax=Pyxicephalus adspersus TaxID=30357 RepID=A0AAV3ATJ2_PYXAD|nr:TPA: hypothetical protein GDO54_008260 [Pyxicephalus adspersus]
MKSIQVSLLGLLFCLVTLTTANDKNVKSGVCPPERFLNNNNYPVHSFCQNDTDCPGKQKCCVDNKFKMCNPPARERPGSWSAQTIPTSQRCHDLCTSDSECASGAKCCFKDCGMECLPLLGEKKKFCPSEDIINCVQAERNLCNSDTGCPDDEKCCPYTCANRCQIPLSERSGKCPTDVTNASKDGTRDQHCTSDYDCKKQHKCCGPKGKKKCLRAV